SYHSSLLSYAYCPLLHLPSFPTRRSSDLSLSPNCIQKNVPDFKTSDLKIAWYKANKIGICTIKGSILAKGLIPASEYNFCCSLRSEEHTSELQSRFDIVCRLLLEKKKIHI